MSTKITYTRQGDYYLPDLKLPEHVADAISKNITKSYTITCSPNAS